LPKRAKQRIDAPIGHSFFFQDSAGGPGRRRPARQGDLHMNVELLHGTTATDLATIRIAHDPSNASHWCHMHARQAFRVASYRPRYSPRLRRELRSFARDAIQGCEATAGASADTAPALSHIGIGSDAHVFNLGGDLELFVRLI